MSDAAQLTGVPARVPTATVGGDATLWRCGGRQCGNGEHEENELHRHASGVGPEYAPPIVHDVLRSPGSPLPAGVRSDMERRLGHDFADVRIHTDSQAGDSALQVQALAWTVGRHVAFAPGNFNPSSEAGRSLIAHELTHAAANAVGPVPSGRLRVSSPDEPAEQHAERSSQSAGRHPAAPVAAPGLMRRGAVAVRPPPRVAPRPRTDARGRPLPVPEGQRYADPDPFDTSLEAGLARIDARAYRDRVIREQERPIATLDRGGDAARGFVTEHGTRRHTWMGGPGGGGSADVRIRRYHVLDALEHAVSRANNERDLEDVVDRFFPVVSLVHQVLDRDHLRRRGGTRPLLLMWDEPVYPAGFDPGARTRLQVLEAAIDSRARQVPALGQSRLKPQTQRRGGCRLEPIQSLGDDPLSGLYCHAVTGSPYSYKITIEQAAGPGLTQRWAEIDALRGNTWFECKCGYERLLTSGVSERVLDRMDHQVLNHKHIATTCGLDYRFVVSNERVRRILQQRWFGNVVIDVRPWEPCD